MTGRIHKRSPMRVTIKLLLVAVVAAVGVGGFAGVVGDSSVPDERVATATTNESSMWSQGVGHAQEGKYYAVAERKVIQSSGHRHVCKAARSNAISASPA